VIAHQINFSRYFYRYSPPRPFEEIEGEIVRMLAEATGGPG